MQPGNPEITPSGIADYSLAEATILFPDRVGRQSPTINLNTVDRITSFANKTLASKIVRPVAAVTTAITVPLIAADIAHAGGPGATGNCEFVLGFQTLEQAIPDHVGACLENQSFAPNGDAQQHTTAGLLVWRKSDNWTAFTDGYHTWVNGPNGIQERLNTERFSFENDTAAAPSAPVVPSVSSTPDTNPNVPHVVDLTAWNLKDAERIQGTLDMLSRLNLNFSVNDFVNDGEIYSSLSDSDRASLPRFIALMDPKELIRSTNRVIPMVPPHSGISWVIPGSDYFEIAPDLVEGRMFKLPDSEDIVLPAVTYKEMFYLALSKAGAQNPEKLSYFGASLEIRKNTQVGQRSERDSFATQERNFAKTAQPV